MPKVPLDALMDVDDNPRPAKRARTIIEPIEADTFAALPPQELLLALPSLLAHPPAHKCHKKSLWLSVMALKRLLGQGELNLELTAQQECRAWTEIAEIGFRIGVDEDGVQKEVEEAVMKALLIAQKHPSLRSCVPNLTRLSAHISAIQGNTRFAQNLLKKQIQTFLVPSDPPCLVYSVHMNYIASLGGAGEVNRSAHTSSSTSTSTNLNSSPVKGGPTTYTPQTANFKVFGAIGDLANVAEKKGHKEVVLLAKVMELREYVSAGFWSKVEEALLDVEKAMGTVFVVESKEKKEKKGEKGANEVGPAAGDGKSRSKIEIALEIHSLIMGIIFYTHVGGSDKALLRTKRMHDMLDNGALDAFGPYGIVEVHFGDSTPLAVQLTHPRVIYGLGFLVSAVAKRDPVGRKPKRKLFAHEGILVLEKEIRKEIPLPIWASVNDLETHRDKIYRMKADMLCEVIGVCITRSEFEDAERTLQILIAHTRTYSLFSFFSARITLHHAHLAHARGNTERALTCYRVAAHLSRTRTPPVRLGMVIQEEDEGCEDRWVNVSARLGEVWLGVGLIYARMGVCLPPRAASVAPQLDEDKTPTRRKDVTTLPPPDEESEDQASEIHEGRPYLDDETRHELDELRRLGSEVVQECEGLGGSLKAAGAILSSCLSTEFLTTKDHIRTASSILTASQDSYLQALTYVLIAAQYVHTSVDHAQDMLNAGDSLAAGLGAASTKNAGDKTQGKDVGNAPLRLWIGEQSLELKRRAGDDEGARRQAKINEKLREVVVAVRGAGSEYLLSF